tara:strand:+ start:540 stop:1337 length:798 start_codon:yes stop_codon:yes gene_type:complete
MEIAIFKGVTTVGVVASIEENSKKYHEGFYADMNNAPERKLVKESASEIGSIIKDIKAEGVKIRKAKIAEVNKEEKTIIERLEKANLPFTKLIDEYTVERKKVLDAEKADKESRERAVQLEIDHEFGLLMNDKFDTDKVAQENERVAYEKQLKADAIAETQQALINAENQAKEDKARAVEQAEQAEVKRLADVEQARINEVNRQAAELKSQQDAEKARLADVAHVRTVNRLIYSAFRDAGLEKGEATIATQALIDNKIPHTQINY